MSDEHGGYLDMVPSPAANLSRLVLLRLEGGAPVAGIHLLWSSGSIVLVAFHHLLTDKRSVHLCIAGRRSAILPVMADILAMPE